jgi:uncharacterized protein
MSTGEICWLEMQTSDVAKAQSFYSNLFGWEKGPGDAGFPYEFLKRPGEEKNFGGMMKTPQPGIPPHWLVYFGVKDLTASLKTVVAIGGKVMSPTVKLPQGGQFAVVSDPQGATFAMFQAS